MNKKENYKIVNPAVSKATPTKFAGTFSIPVKVRVYPLSSDIAAPVTIVPPVTTNPFSNPAKKKLSFWSFTIT